MSDLRAILRSTWLVVLVVLVVARNRDCWFPALLAFHVPWKSQKRYAQFCVLPALRLRGPLPLPESGIVVPATLVSGLGCFRRGCSLSPFLSIRLSLSLSFSFSCSFSPTVHEAWLSWTRRCSARFFSHFAGGRLEARSQGKRDSWMWTVRKCLQTILVFISTQVLYMYISGLKHRKWDHDTDG